MSVMTISIGFIVSAASLPLSLPQQSSELKALEHYVGKWKFEGTIGDSGILRGSVASRFVLDNSFVQQELRLSSGAGDEFLKLMFLRTWDAKLGKYRSWSFASGGDTLEWTGAWNADTRSITWKAERGDDHYTLTSEFTDDGRENWSLITQDEFGNQRFSFRGTNVREKD